VNLALLYLKGQGVAQDEPKGFELLRQAAEAGAPDAQLQIGMDYDQGTHGVKQDKGMAEKWLRKSADQGNVAAQFNLAMLIYSNKAEAYYWLSLAAPHLKGEPLAMTNKLRDGAAAMLKPAERAKIDEHIKQWQTEHHD